ncbi:MLO-like protein 12 [Corylus avellana]|uniref:MLO-like protein 12 n=1 Tax=Corylus avellana TaxID=13451 RepID=UPI00286B6426|nr:MLO-like protein 12 [Corylus avellana]
MAEEEVTTTAVERTLQITPTWAVATVCFFLILISILIEKSLCRLGKYFTKKRRKSLIQALDKIKSELMLLGFISLLLNVSERRIAKTCIPKNVGETFLPCSDYTTAADVEEETKCAEQGKVSLLSRGGVQELQYLIFMLGVFHIFSSVLTFSLGMAKMRRWESWEAETRSLEYQFSNDPRRFQLTHQTSFGKRHLKYWSDHRFLRWPACFLRQFFKSVYKVDYFILRHGFITAHFAEGSNFDFQKYIRRTMEKDFGVVVGIRWWIWIFTVFFLFFNAHVFRSYYWLPFFPLVMLLIVGTKLQGIITKMCLDSHEKSQVIRGTLLVRPSDHFFWFGWPKLLLHLIHFILFQNSFQLAFFAWTWYKFGFRSCFHKENEDIIIRLAMGVVVQVLCGYVTLPLYALVTQMGTSMRKDVFTEGVVNGLKRWRVKAKKNVALRNTNNYSLDTSLETSLVDTSPSFNTLEATISVESGSPSDAEYVAVGVEDEEKGIVGGRSQPEEKQKVMGGSFHGFDVVKEK